MSKSEHLHHMMTRKQGKNAVFTTGTAFVKPNSVNLRFTHRELTLIIGIIVALIVVVTLWMNHAQLLDAPTKSDAAKTPLTGMLRQSIVNLDLPYRLRGASFKSK
jgi:hypothetical protein